MRRKVKWSFAMLLGLVLLMAGQFQGADIQSLAQALDANGNGYLDDAEVLQAVQYWVTGEPVPGTGGHVISDAEILANRLADNDKDVSEGVPLSCLGA